MTMDQRAPHPHLHGLLPVDAHALLARLLEIADDAIIVADDALEVVLFNEGAERVFGCPAADMLGRPVAMLLPEGLRALHNAHMRTFAHAPRAARRMGERRDIQGQRVDGRLFDAEASISHLEVDGRTFFTVILRDVTEARAAARALAASEARFRQLAAAAPVGIFQADAAGACSFVNDRWCEITGLTAAEAAGGGWTAALHPADRARVREAWHEAVSGSRPFALRYRFLRADGTETWVDGQAAAQPGPAGSVAGWIGTISDVTASLRQAADLERAKSEAEAAARAKSLFLANMSHEIRTPLNAVIGMTTLLLDTPMSEDQHDFARTIHASSEALLACINDILDYSKADVGKLELERAPFDLRHLVEESLDLVTPRALEKGLNLAYQIEEGTPEALIGDAARLRQILTNLLSNAVKFTHQGEVLTTVDCVATEEAAVRLHLAVEDTGIGIAAEHLPRLFQSFSQVDPSTTRKYGGTGLGLAISKRLAELMGGEVKVESTPGRGSVFHVWVRLERAAVAPAMPFLQRDAPALAGKRILIVDDNQSNRRILARFAMLWGMRPSTLPSALEALDRVRHGEPFDVAVLDVSMPHMDGVELARQLHQCPGAEALPVVFLTSLGQRPAAGAAGDGARFAACLSKPIKASQLYDTLVATVNGEAPAAPQRPDVAPTPPRQALQVLVAEDHPINQRVVLRLLKHLGHHAEAVGNGREALEAVARRHFDVVLMDIQMPELDGIQAARAIVRKRGPQGLPRIIAMTANAMPGDREVYMATGMDGYLAKPVELRDLADALGRSGASPLGVDPALAELAIDAGRLEHIRSMQDDSQPSLVRELIDMFDGDSTSHIRRIADAQVRGDAPALRTFAHRFLSATQNIGALRLSALCAEIESLARQERLEEAGQLVEALSHERAKAVSALAALRSRY
ncbi:MAG TPA: response regulator [Burkholderiaceae bacterium]|nr:response regulator [Burkholderiaceae bacterium]